MNRKQKKILNGITTVLVALVVVIAILLVGVRLVGLKVYTVLSGSMEPTYHTGALLYVKACEPEEIEEGDPISFVMDGSLTVATHRVIEIDEVEGCFYTKGDANETPDAAPVYYENLIGKPVFSIPYMGYLANYIQSPVGRGIAIIVGIIILVMALLPDLLKKKTADDSKH